MNLYVAFHGKDAASRKETLHGTTAAWLIAVVASTSGLLFSYYLDFVVGPAIALCLGIVPALVARLTTLRTKLASRPVQVQVQE